MKDKCRNRDEVRLVFLFFPLIVSLLFCGGILWNFLRRFRELLTRQERKEWDNRLPGIFIALVFFERFLRIGEVVLQYEIQESKYYRLVTDLLNPVVFVLVLYEQTVRLQSCFEGSIYSIPTPIVQRIHSLTAIVTFCSTLWAVVHSFKGVLYTSNSQMMLIFLASVTAVLGTINVIVIDFAFASRLRKVVATQETMSRQSIGESPNFGNDSIISKPKLKDMHLQTLSVFDSTQQILLVVVCKHTILSQFLTLAMFLVCSAMIGFTLADCVQPLAIVAHYCFAAGMSVVCVCGMLGLQGNQEEYDTYCQPCNRIMRKVVAYKTTRKMSRMSRADRGFSSGFSVRSRITSPAGSPIPTPSRTNQSSQAALTAPDPYNFAITLDNSVGSAENIPHRADSQPRSGSDSSVDESSVPDPTLIDISFKE